MKMKKRLICITVTLALSAGALANEPGTSSSTTTTPLLILEDKGASAEIKVRTAFNDVYTALTNAKASYNKQKEALNDRVSECNNEVSCVMSHAQQAAAIENDIASRYESAAEDIQAIIGTIINDVRKQFEADMAANGKQLNKEKVTYTRDFKHLMSSMTAYIDDNGNLKDDIPASVYRDYAIAERALASRYKRISNLELAQSSIQSKIDNAGKFKDYAENFEAGLAIAASDHNFNGQDILSDYDTYIKGTGGFSESDITGYAKKMSDVGQPNSGLSGTFANRTDDIRMDGGQGLPPMKRRTLNFAVLHDMYKKITSGKGDTGQDKGEGLVANTISGENHDE